MGFSLGGIDFGNVGSSIGKLIDDNFGTDLESTLSEVGEVANEVSGYANSSFSGSGVNYASLLSSLSGANSPTQALKNALASKALGYDASILSDAEIFSRIGSSGSIAGLTDQEAASLQSLLGSTSSSLSSNSSSATMDTRSPEIAQSGDARLRMSLKDEGWTDERIDRAMSTKSGREQAEQFADNIEMQSTQLFWAGAMQRQKMAFDGLQQMINKMG